jgi:hypothetical protein
METRDDTQLRSAAGLGLLFLSSLAVAALAVGSGIYEWRLLWFVVFLVITATSARGANMWAALYGGAVAGLFHNFTTHGGELAFRTALDWADGGTFVIVAVITASVMRWRRQPIVAPVNPPEPAASLNVAAELPSAHIHGKDRLWTS